MSTQGFKKDDQVRYIPRHAEGDASHPDCENGIVTSTNEVNVFVKYYHSAGGLRLHAQATSPEDLINLTQRASASKGESNG